MNYNVSIIIRRYVRMTYSTTDKMTLESTKISALNEGIIISNDHMEVLLALQHYYDAHEDLNRINVRELHDALTEKFHIKGGMKYLYSLFPKGPIAQGCRLAGLEPPAGAVDKGFGSSI
jgi:tRNA 2-thiouridine synthesizing protein E